MSELESILAGSRDRITEMLRPKEMGLGDIGSAALQAAASGNPFGQIYAGMEQQNQNKASALLNYLDKERSYGLQREQLDRQNRALDLQSQEYVLRHAERKAAEGDRQAKAVLDTVNALTDDPSERARLMSALHSDPEKITPENVQSKAGMYAVQLGVKGKPKERNVQTVQTAEGVFTLNPDATLGTRLGGLPKEAGKDGAGPFGGTSMDAQYLNMLLKGDPTSPEYAAAYAQMSAPKISGYDQATGRALFQTPDMSAFRKPTFGMAPTAPVSPAPGATPPVSVGGSTVTSIPVAPEKLKEIPPNINTAIQENVTAIRKIDSALNEWNVNKDATGFLKGVGNAVLPGDTLNSLDPSGAKLRALISDIGSLKIHDRSGAAVSASEFPRLKPFVPQIGDSPETIRTKLENFKAEYLNTLRDQASVYNEANGYKPNPTIAPLLSGRQDIPPPPPGFQIVK